MLNSAKQSFYQNIYYHLVDDISVGIKVSSNYFADDLCSNYLFFPSINVDLRNDTSIGCFIKKRNNNAFIANLYGDFTNLHDKDINYYKVYFNSDIAQVNFMVDANLCYTFLRQPVVVSKIFLTQV